MTLSIWMRASYFLGGLGTVHIFAYQPLKVYLQRSQLELQGLVNEQEENIKQHGRVR